jgi:hypothetical protein
VELRALFWILVGLAFLAVVALVVMTLRRRRQEQLSPAEQQTVWERAGAEGGEGLGAGLRRLRDRLAGVLSPLRAPDYPLATAREIYASLQRLAAWKGAPRDEAETPYEYERTLDKTWPEAKRDVLFITEAYIRAHYGELEIPAGELDALRAAWQRILKQTEGEEPGPPP